MATHKPRLDPILMGEAKILVEVTTRNDVEVGNGSAPSSALIATFQSTTPISVSSMKEPIASTFLGPAKESLLYDQTISTIEEEHTISANVPTIEKVPTSTTFISIESPLLRTAQISSVTAHAHANATVHRERAKSADHNLGSNQFASLVSSDEEEDLSDSDNESDSMDLMTPSGKRILRERPVKPSTKAKEMHGQTTCRGRGRGRGKRGGRG
ncbi:predicted protein [Arabidopsis lyrata subsp. lyrata]|uniref:Predicted protein n=1 Tax=Arabidopsis lyrata subsp. lyrata TaxID=81972 RepID=D7LRH5_ARALL|nr:predicted protein [Arabidopsis lyrata subsp. lyrata]